LGGPFAELRELAHGIFPAVLIEAGLGAAVSSLAETSPIPVDVDCTVTERLPATVETAAYAVAADGLQAVSRSGAASATVTIARHEDHIVVAVTPDRCDGLLDIVHVADRVGAAGGTLLTAPDGLRAEIPCAS
jgi:signal transduction histidine kinase